MTLIRQSKMMYMKRKHLQVGLFFLLILTFSFLFTSCASSPEKVLERIAQETNQSCPVFIDEYTTMTNAEVYPNRTLIFKYSVKGNFTEEAKQELTEAMKPILISRLKERKELEFYLVNNVRFEHIFLDAQNRPVAHVKIEALDYK